MNRVLLFFIRAYRLVVSPLLGARCRFYPSCSEYAQEALKTHEWKTALKLSLMRTLKCHPRNPGGVDLVPHSSTSPLTEEAS